MHPGEGRAVRLMLLHSFFMGASTVFFETAASALFLARFGPAALPWAYLAAALLNTLVGIVYARVQSRLAFARLMTGTLWFLFASVSALWIGARTGAFPWLPFLLLVWYRALSILTDLEYWAVAARLFDVRQAKRLFGRIGSGEVVARIAGSFAVPLLVPVLGVVNLTALSALALAGCILLASRVLRATADGVGEAVRGTAPVVSRKKRAWLETLLADPYLRTVVALAFFSVLAKYLVDFAFLAQMRERSADANQLATFFALFSGTTQALSLLCRLFVSGPLLERFGIRVGLLVLPMAHAACTAAIVAAGLLPEEGALVFWLVVANQGIYKTLKHPVDNPSFKVLYQPLPRDVRLSTQVTVETLVTPITIGVAGALMLLFSRARQFDPVLFAWAMLAAFAAWVWVARRAGPEYADALVDALRRRVVDDEPAALRDPRSLEVLERTVATGRPGDVAFALDLMEKVAHPRLDAALVRLLDHPSPDIRRRAIHRLERRGVASARAAVTARLATEAAPVRAAALRYLCAVGGAETWPTVMPALDDPDPVVRRGALVGLLRAESPEAFRHLVVLAGSSRPADRAEAARVIADVARRGLHSPLQWLLMDVDPQVRRAALLAAGRVRSDELWPVVAGNLGERAFRASAAQALIMGGGSALSAMAPLLLSPDPTIAQQAAFVLGRMSGHLAAVALESGMDVADPRVRLEVLRGLSRCGWRPLPGEAEAMRSRLRREIEDAAWTAAVRRDVSQGEALSLLRRALDAESARNREAVLLLLSFMFEAEAFPRAAAGLAHPSREKRAFAVEVLDVTLDAELKPLVMPLVEELAPEERATRLAEALGDPTVAEPRPPVERLADVIGDHSRLVAPLTRAAAVHAAAILPAAELLGEVREARDDGTRIVRQTAKWAEARLGGGATDVVRGQGGHMLTIEKVILLKSVPMFEEASEEILADVADLLEEVEVDAEQVVFEKGASGDSMYVVASGSVRVQDGPRIITTLGEKEIFGELALLDPEPRFASIVAAEPTRLLRLDREAFAELMAGNIEVVRGVLHVLCERLRQQAASGGRPWSDPTGHR